MFGGVLAPIFFDHNKFPVEENHSVTPPNSLRLKWRSKTGGDWDMTLDVRARYGMPEFSASNLFVWCYTPEDFPADASPRIYLRDSNGESTTSIQLTGSLAKVPARKWTRLRGGAGAAEEAGIARAGGRRSVQRWQRGCRGGGP